MPARGKVAMLPEEVRAWLDQELIHGSFSGYVALTDELQARGFEISKSAVHRYGQEFEAQMGAIRLATEQAKAIAESAGDEEGALNNALIQLIQTKAFEVLTNLEAEKIDESFTDLGNMLARLGKTAIDQKKWASQVRQKVQAKLESLEKEAKKGVPGKAGLDPETLRRVREEIYGII